MHSEIWHAVNYYPCCATVQPNQRLATTIIGAAYGRRRQLLSLLPEPAGTPPSAGSRGACPAAPPFPPLVAGLPPPPCSYGALASVTVGLALPVEAAKSSLSRKAPIPAHRASQSPAPKVAAPLPATMSTAMGNGRVRPFGRYPPHAACTTRKRPGSSAYAVVTERAPAAKEDVVGVCCKSCRSVYLINVYKPKTLPTLAADVPLARTAERNAICGCHLGTTSVQIDLQKSVMMPLAISHMPISTSHLILLYLCLFPITRGAGAVK